MPPAPLPAAPEEQQHDFANWEDARFDAFDTYEPPSEDIIDNEDEDSRLPVSDHELQRNLVTAFAIKTNLSEADTVRLEELLKSFVGDNLLTSATDIKKARNSWIAPFAINEKIFCSRNDCRKEVRNMTVACSCGSKRDERIIVSKASVIPQIFQCLKNNERYLLQERLPTDKRSDLLHYMEINNEESTLNLELLLNTDGVQPKANSRRPFHPILLMIKNLPGFLRSNIKNMLIAGVIIGAKVPPEWIWKNSTCFLKSELEQLKSGVTYICKNGRKILVKATVTDVILDQIAAKMVYRLSGHTAYGFACPTCEIFPTYQEGGMRWPIKAGVLREQSAGLGTVVFPSAFSELAPFGKMRLDGLHVIDEGLGKSLLHYLFNKTKIMESIRLEVSRCMLVNGNSCYAYSKGLASLNAHELRLLFSISIPILTNTANLPSLQLQIELSYLFWLLCRLLYSQNLTKEIIEAIASVFLELGQFMEMDFDTLFRTIKAHRFFVHGAEELLHFGSPADFSASPFESVNRLLKLLFDPGNTRAFDRTLIQKTLEHTMVEGKMEDMIDRMNLDPSTYFGIYGTAPKKTVAQAKPFTDDLLPQMLPDDLVFYSIAKHGFTHKFNPKKGSSAYFKSNVNGSGELYKGILGIERDGQRFMLAQKVNAFNPINPQNFHAKLRPICDKLSKWQSFFFEFNAVCDDYVLVPFINIISFVLYINFNNRQMLFDVSERYNKA